MTTQADWLTDTACQSLLKNTQQWQQTAPEIRKKVVNQLRQLPALNTLGSAGQQFMVALEQGSEQLPVLLRQLPNEQLGQFLEQTEAYFYQSPQAERLALKAILNLCASTLFVTP